MAVEERECPLCMEPMETDDLSFYPCDCGYQVCRFCWTKIINEENGLCPACRKTYNSEKPALYKPVPDHDDGKLRANRKRKEHLKKNRLNSEMLKLLPELRVVQNNLIFVVGLPAWVCKDKEILKGQEYFGRYGKVFKVEINQNQTFGGPQGQPSFSAYITFHRPEDAMRSIRELDQGMLHGRTLRVSLGTTKYCSQFLRGSKCTKHECMYLHSVGDPDASFTKEEMQAGKHTEYMNKLLAQYDASVYATGGGNGATTNNSNHMPATVGVNNSADDDHHHQQSRPRDTLVSPRLVATVGGGAGGGSSSGELSTSPYPTSSARHPGRGGNLLSISPLKLSTSAGQQPQSSPVTHLSTQPLESGEARKMSAYPGNRTCSHSAGHTGADATASQVAGSPIQTFSSDCGDKEICWIQPETLPSNAAEVSKSPGNRAPQISQINANYFNGFVPDDNGPVKERLLAKVANSRRGMTNRLLGSQRLPPPSSASKTTSLSVKIPPQVANWYRAGQSSECSSSQHLTSSGYGDESVDLGFDPFQESQQGLAELLAAELSQLSAESENAKPPVDYSAGNPENTGVLRARHVDSFTHSKPLPMYWHPAQTAVPDSEENDRLDYSNAKSHHGYFTSRLYPPPGFEKNTHSMSSEAVNSQSFPNPTTTTTVKSLQGSARLLGSKCQQSACQMVTQSGFTGQIPDEPGLLNNLAASCLIDRNMNVSFPVGFRSEVAHDKLNGGGAVSCEDIENSGGSIGLPLLSDTGAGPLRPDARQQQEQQQAMANLFAAAFNTASAMLNSNRQQQQSSDDKAPVGFTSSPPPFDLNAFFSQLYRQSPFLFSQSSSGDAGGGNSVTSASSPLNGITDWFSDPSHRGRDTTGFPVGLENVVASDAITSTSFTKGTNHGGGAGAGNTALSVSTTRSALDTAMAATTANVLIPSMLSFPPRSANDYSLNGPLYPPGLAKPPGAPCATPISSAGHSLNKTVIGSSHVENRGGNGFSPSGKPAAAVSFEHDPRRVTVPLTWQLDDPAIVTSQLRSSSSQSAAPGWKESTNCSSNNDEEAMAAAASLRQFWQSDPTTVQQQFNQHLLQSSLNYPAAMHAGNGAGGAHCQTNNSQQQQITCSSSSAIPLHSAANNATESSE